MGYAQLGLPPGTGQAGAPARVVQEVMAGAGKRREVFVLSTGVSTSVTEFNAAVGRERPR